MARRKRRGPSIFRHKPIRNSGIYEFRIYDVFEIEMAKKAGINPPSRNLEPVNEGVMKVYATDCGFLVLDRDPDTFFEDDAFYPLNERGKEGWDEWYSNPDCDDDYFCRRKIATNPQKLVSVE